MTERSRFWDGTATGDATIAPYDAGTEFAEALMALGGGNSIATHRGGVFNDNLNLLAASGAVTPVAIATGRALVYGSWYENDASVNVTIPTPAGATRIDRIVLRKDWAAQTVRITRIAGAEGGAAPALTQNAGTTWDIPLCQVSITVGGAITLTDERCFLRPFPLLSGVDGATITFDLARSPLWTVILGGNRTLALSNAGSAIPTFMIRLVQDSTGSRTVTWFAGISWAGGAAPTLTTTINKADTFMFLRTAAGAYAGFIVGMNE